jgi:L-seryl-tRNA(Ser) seleniumtransferase
MNSHKEAYKSLPGVDTLLASAELHPLQMQYGKELLTYAIRQSLAYFRYQISQHLQIPELSEIVESVAQTAHLLGQRHLRKVFNTSGIIIHTNLGRAPFSAQMLQDSFDVLQGYNNLEFDLETAKRGSRNDHAADLLRFLTGAEDVLVVNNAAAAVMMVLRAFAKNREVIVSRGELIEIGGSFRIPDIMAASDCQMVEVGTTNKTKLGDFERAVSAQTGLLFKAHKSNYIIKGFTEEISPGELAKLGKKYDIPVLYDLGSGLLRKIDHPALSSEPDVRQALVSGVDLVCFSGDKLLGGPQAGIIAGKKILIEKLKKEPMMRALRVCKTTLALLETACSYYLRDKDLNEKNLIFKAFNRDKARIRQLAESLQAQLQSNGIASEVQPSEGQCGGGTLPDAAIDSFALKLHYGKSNKEKASFAARMHQHLLLNKKPVLAILKQGQLLFDMLTVDENDLETIANTIVETYQLVLEKK